MIGEGEKMIHIKMLNGEWKHYHNHQRNRLESLGYDVINDYDFIEQINLK